MYWTCGRRVSINGTNPFVWSLFPDTNIPFGEHIPWKWNQPDFYLQNEFCIHLNAFSEVNDNLCWYQYCVICESTPMIADNATTEAIIYN